MIWVIEITDKDLELLKIFNDNNWYTEINEHLYRWNLCRLLFQYNFYDRFFSGIFAFLKAEETEFHQINFEKNKF